MDTVVNARGRELPEYIEGYGDVIPYKGQWKHFPEGRRYAAKVRTHMPGESKLLSSVEQAIERTGLCDGMTISFHHHFREGDRVLNMVVDVLAKKGIKDITLAPSSIFNVHKPVIEHMKNGVITAIEGSCNGAVGAAISNGIPMKKPLILRSHGGRARAIMAGELKIDVAFIAAPCIDDYGNMNGVMGPSACGPLAYSVADAMYADQVVAVTDNLQPYPVIPISISQCYVDYIVEVDKIGDPDRIVSGTTKITKDPRKLIIAKNCAKFIAHCENFKTGMGIQGGAGGISLAVMAYLRNIMKSKEIVAEFVNGGTTRVIVEMLEEGTTKKLLEGQSFDKAAIESLRENPMHEEIDINHYANMFVSGNTVDRLDFGFLGGTEIDTNFNVNVNSHSDGLLAHGIGGHADVAAGAKVSMITLPLMRHRVCTITDNVLTCTTPGDTIDAIITDYGIAINPDNEDLTRQFANSHLPMTTIDALRKKGEKLVGKARKPDLSDNIVAIIEYRDGTVMDVAYSFK